MRFHIGLPLFFFTLVGFAQEKKSLLWEISGNGMEQSSYLYGTMHVSKKIAFRLDDVFYEALHESEIVALESDPGTWLEEAENLENSGYGRNTGFSPKGFYVYPFLVKNPKKEEIGSYLAFEDRVVNNILYRTDDYSQNFEEETYLDMFIYQAGKKLNKPIVALEDLGESTALVGRASLNALKPKPDEWLQKRMQQEDPMVMLQDAYRDRNLNLIDSIDKATYSQHYLKNMLYLRNRNMVEKLDSIMQGSKVFTGIGAAHLPGEKGVISLLRLKGYNVRPLTSRATSKGRELKEEFETKVLENDYGQQSPDDNFFSLLLPSKLYPISEYVNTTYISPDLTNGSYIMINRIPTFSHLKKDALFTIEDIDKFLFENIPGKILEKKPLNKNGFPGLDVKNQLKNGDHQRYHIYVTPLEIIIFKMSGEGNYVTTHSDTIFNSIHFKDVTYGEEILTSGYEDFEVAMPSLHTFPNKFRNGNRIIEGYDEGTKSYYFLKKATLNDFNFIEEDSFELKQIQKRFYQDLQLNPVYDPINGLSLTSHALFNKGQGKELHLKTLISRGDYFLLGALTSDGNRAKSFFESFKIKSPQYSKTFERIRDTAMYFSTVSTASPPKFVENSNNYFSAKNRPKTYAPYNKKSIYWNNNDEAISVEVSKAHDYLMFPSIDSVWSLRKKIHANGKFLIINEKRTVSPGGYHELNFSLADTASVRGILVKNIAKGGLLYEIKAAVDTLSRPTEFVNAFFDNFKPMDTVVGRGFLEDKVPDFFAALRSNDSIIQDGFRFLLFKPSHLDSLTHYVSEFDFKDDQKNIQSHLIQKMGQMKDPRVFSFFREFYERSYGNSSAQGKILQAIAKKKDASSTALLLELMSKDLPLVSNNLEIHAIFKPYMDSLALAKKLYPEILDYSGIEEYKGTIFSILANLRSDGLVKPKIYKKFRKQILNDAKLQLKRHLGQTGNTMSQSHITSAQRILNVPILMDYMILLHPFIREKEVALFFDRLLLSGDPKIRTLYVSLSTASKMDIPQGMIDSLAAKGNSRAILYRSLKKQGELELFPKAYGTARLLAEGYLIEQEGELENPPIFVAEKEVEYRQEKYMAYYYKVREEQDFGQQFKMYVVVFEKDGDSVGEPYYCSKGMTIEDTDTELETIRLATEEFILRNRPRSILYRPYQYGSFGQFSM
tara:strand:+ start:64149 stop:67667 length:3519 start_codon:yes stop_codon:yes gene_type:complete